MSIYILRTQPSNSARELVEALNGRRLRDNSRVRPTNQDLVIAWGESYNGPGRVLNGTPIRNKFQDALTLAQKGVPTVVVAQERPVVPAPAPPPVDPILERWSKVNELISDWPVDFPGRSPVVLAGLQQFEQALTAARDAFLNGPPVPVVQEPPIEWLGRTRNHIGGRDLLNPPLNPDYWVKKENIVHEYRVHSFLGASIRAGKKKEIEGAAHDPARPWVRSLLNGWKISYDGVSIKQAHRNLAHQACEALGLQFGAVDIGEKDDGTLIVLEVNRAPGLEGGTITAYANAIRKWINGEA